MNLPEVDEPLGLPESRIRNARNNLQLSQEQLLEYAAAL